jgi:hypothetical protein
MHRPTQGAQNGVEEVLAQYRDAKYADEKHHR